MCLLNVLIKNRKRKPGQEVSDTLLLVGLKKVD